MANREQRSKDKLKMKKKKEKEKSSAVSSNSSNAYMPESYISKLTECRSRMQSSIDKLINDLKPLSTGRVEPGIIESVTLPELRRTIGEISTIIVKSARSLLIQIYENGALSMVERALMDKALEHLRLQLSIDSADNAITVNFPKLSNEMKNSLLKVIRQKCEECKSAIRTTRSMYLQQMQKTMKNDLSADEQIKLKQNLQRVTDEMVDLVVQAEKEKERELSQ